MGLSQDKTVLKLIKLDRIISLTGETLKSKAVLSAQKVGKAKNENYDKIKSNRVLAQQFLP